MPGVFNIYAWNPVVVVALCAVAVVMAAWAGAVCVRRYRDCGRPAAFRTCCVVALVALVAVCLMGILKFTVLGRTPSGGHVFAWCMDPAGNEFIREQIMNAFLYVPLGICLPFFLAALFWRRRVSWAPVVCTVGVAFLLSLGIEAWQYFVGTGTAQATDVVCNTLGAAIGSLAYVGAATVR